MGVVIDVVAVFATVFGIATSLGLGVTQINSRPR
nr:BCCT family transporter [Glutamicibacter soli]